MKLADANRVENCNCVDTTVEKARKHKAALIKIMNTGLGISAPQVGIFERFFVMKNNRGVEPWLVVNPVIEDRPEKVGTFMEGCLTYPGEFYRVRRKKTIRAMWTDETGEKVRLKLSGREAQVFQHEFDHLNGVTIKMIAE